LPDPLYVLNGEFMFFCDGRKILVGAGGYMFLPRGIPHGIRVTGDAPSTMLILATPGTGLLE
jgi:quercetin dioxygenase-like cupin family protein